MLQLLLVIAVLLIVYVVGFALYWLLTEHLVVTLVVVLISIVFLKSLYDELNK